MRRIMKNNIMNTHILIRIKKEHWGLLFPGLYALTILHITYNVCLLNYLRILDSDVENEKEIHRKKNETKN